MTPISFGSETITELQFQELKAKHMRQLPKEVGIGDILNLAATLTGVPPKVLDEMTANDTLKVVEVVNDFFPNSQETTQEG